MEALLKLLGVRRRNQGWLTFLVVLLLFILTFLFLRSCVGGNVQGNYNTLTVRQPVLPNGAVVGQEFPFRGTFQGTEAVELYLNGERIGRTWARRNGDWQLSSSISKPGIYSLQAIGIDSNSKEIKSSRYPIEIYPARTFDSFGEVNNLHNIIGEGNGADNAMNVARFGSGVPLIDEALNGLTIAPGRFFLTGSGTPDSRVFVTNNGEPLGTVQVNNDGRWRTNVNLLTEGKNHFEASNADVVGLSSSTADVRVAIPAKAPTIGIVRDGDISTVNLRGRGEAGDTLLIHHNDEEVGTALVSDFGTWSLTNVPLADGDSTNVFTASVLDDAGEIAATSPPVTLNVRRLSGDGNDDAGSSAGSGTGAMVALTLQASADGDVADLSGTGEPNTTLRIMQNGQEVDMTNVDSDGNWSLAGVELESGENMFVAEGEPDGDAIPVSNFAIVNLSGGAVSAPPTLQASANGDVADLSGTGEPNTTLRIMQNGQEVDTADVDSDGNWSLAGVELENGENMFVAEGDAIPVSNFVIVNFSGDTVSAPPTLQASANGDVADLSGTGQPNTTLRIMQNGQEVDTADVDSDGNWSLANVDLESGENEFVAEAEPDGDETAISAPVIVNGAATTMSGNVTINTPEYDADAVTLNSAGIPVGAIAFSGTGLPADARVVIVYDDEEAGETTVDDDGEWAFSAELPLTPGEHSAYALIFDEDGEAVESDPVTFAGIDQMGELSVIFVDNANGEEGDGSETTDNGEAASAASNLPVVELILDASWSMTFPLDSAEEADRLTANNPDSRFAIARNTLIDIVDNSLVSGQPIGLRVFGNLSGNLECQTDVMIPVGPLNKEATTDLLRRTAPQYNANTAIAASLAGAANDLDGIEGNITIVLLTDGQETCEGDVAAEIEALREAGIDVTVDVVGFAILDDELRAEFETWAELGGGTYYDARDGEALAEALTSTLQASFLVEDASGEIVARGAVGSTVELPIGQYTVRVGSQSYDVVVTAEGSEVVVK